MLSYSEVSSGTSPGDLETHHHPSPDASFCPSFPCHLILLLLLKPHCSQTSVFFSASSQAFPRIITSPFQRDPCPDTPGLTQAGSEHPSGKARCVRSVVSLGDISIKVRFSFMQSFCMRVLGPVVLLENNFPNDNWKHFLFYVNTVP